jgi:hypothetical protein
MVEHKRFCCLSALSCLLPVCPLSCLLSVVVYEYTLIYDDQAWLAWLKFGVCCCGQAGKERKKTHTNTHTHTHVHLHTHFLTHMYAHTFLHTCTHTHTHTHTHICVLVHTNTHLHPLTHRMASKGGGQMRHRVKVADMRQKRGSKQAADRREGRQERAHRQQTHKQREESRQM